MVLPLTAADAPGSGAATEPDQPANADDAAAAIVERRDEALAALERGLGRAVKRVLADEQNAILDAVRPKKRQKRTELDDILPASDEHAMRYAVAAKAELRAAVQAGAELAGGETADVGVDDLAAAMALSVCRPLRERVDQAFASSENPDALASELRGLYREWKTDRVDQCAREFSAEAFNRGVRMVDAEPSADLLAPAEGRSALTAR
jgi:phage gp46-like protein